VLRRHRINRQRFRNYRKVLHAEEEQELSPLASSDSEEEFEEPNQFEELFERDDSDDWYTPRYLPSSFGGIQLLRKRWLSVQEESVFYERNSFLKSKHERKYHFLKDKVQRVPAEDPSNSSIAFPPSGTPDFEEWSENEGPGPVYTVRAQGISHVIHDPPRPPWETDSSEDVSVQSLHRAIQFTQCPSDDESEHSEESPPAAFQSPQEIVPDVPLIVPDDQVPASRISEVSASPAPGIPAVTQIRSESPFGSVSCLPCEPLCGDLE
jgi:hypothetical protein